mgnify:CR=1 FL=1|tara:strand:- start:3701 stop:3898 length:198 start_codon:yes stop_codon:yes gene_type:complete
MRFIVPVNEVINNGSQTVHIIDTESDCARTNKRKLKAYFREMGVQSSDMKPVMKAMGFWGKGLGV